VLAALLERHDACEQRDALRARSLREPPRAACSPCCSRARRLCTQSSLWKVDAVFAKCITFRHIYTGCELEDADDDGGRQRHATGRARSLDSRFVPGSERDDYLNNLNYKYCNVGRLFHSRG
jgi:hypothetical protein